MGQSVIVGKYVTYKSKDITGDNIATSFVYDKVLANGGINSGEPITKYLVEYNGMFVLIFPTDICSVYFNSGEDEED